MTREEVISFSYSNAFGDASKRTIVVDQIYESAGRVYIEGFCRLRGDTRTFRADRIIGDIFLHATNNPISPERYCLAKSIKLSPSKEEEEPYKPPTQHWGSGNYVQVKAILGVEGADIANRQKRCTLTITEYNGSSWLNGFCEESQRRETFLVEKVDRCVDLTTGAAINDIPQFLLGKYHESPGYILEQGMEKLADILSVLFYVGKADGQLRAEERQILRAVVRKVSKHELITDDMIDRELNKQTVPSIQAIKLAINRICKANGHNMAITFRIAQLIVGTQKKVHPSEAEIMEYMERKLKQEGIVA